MTTLRVASHQVKSPNALAQPFIQDVVISKKSALDQPQCNINGSAQMNLLLSIDTTQKSVTIGGGVPQAVVGAPNGGTCWASFVDPSSGLSVTPVTTSFTEDAGGTLTAFFSTFVLPVYLEDATTSDSYFLLPLHEMQLHAKLSSDRNCIGRYAAETLDPAFSCQPASGQFAWQTAGGYQGFIKVDEADDVMVTSLGSTLCVLFTGDPAMWKGPNGDCQSSSGFQSTGGLPKGDWCSATNAPGGCADAWHVAIDIAAQAIDIDGTFDAVAGTCMP